MFLDNEMKQDSTALDQIFQDSKKFKYSCLLSIAINNTCKIISKAIEYLNFINELSIEDQFIILKYSYFPVDLAIFCQNYDEELFFLYSTHSMASYHFLFIGAA